MRSEVVVTGDGAIAAIGRSVEACMESLYAGRAPVPRADSLPTTLAVPPPVFAVAGEIEIASRRPLNRTSRLALHALREAMDRGWGGRLPVDASRVGVCMGTTVGSAFNDEDWYAAFRRGRDPGIDSLTLFLGNELSEVVAESVGADGPRATVVNACASGTDAVGIAASWVAEGLCDVAIAGGADALARYPYLGFSVLMNCSKEPCRPFDKNRKGLNLGEGAAMLLLERGDDARRRGARVLGRVAGYGSCADAHHPTAPHPDGRGLRAAIREALDGAGIDRAQIGFVNAHGTGTNENDRVEGRVFSDTFPPELRVFSTKAYTGHTLGAAGALEAIFTLRNLADGRVPASAGFETPDPECRIVPTRATTPVDVRAALSTSLAFGGSNSALIFTKGSAA